MTTPHPKGSHEEYETMPWAMLADELDRGKNRTLALTVIAAVAVGILAFMVVRSIRQPPGTMVEAPPAVESAAATTTVAVTMAPMTATTVIPSVTVPEDATVAPPAADAVLYSEEDLKAGVPDVDVRMAVVTAEWFVSEYFSTGEVSDGLVPEGSPPREVPEGAYAWVEWARAVAVDGIGSGRYDVTVVFRAMVGDAAQPIAAAPPRAVLVPVLIDGTGASAVIDLPAPLPLPPRAEVDPPPEADEDVPEAVAAAAVEQSAPFGEAAVVVGGAQLEGGWRVVVTVTDGSGASYPLAIFVSG
ncbi:MAG: hypothetical protein H0V96_04035 [Acidimicrobiia bacterium]|nr:hypothetical protein [Acidimicrobiia bacterium]